MRRTAIALVAALGLGMLGGCGTSTLGASGLPDSCQRALDAAWDAADAQRRAANAYVDAYNFANDQAIAAGARFDDLRSKAERLVKQANDAIDSYTAAREQCQADSGGRASHECVVALDATAGVVQDHQQTMLAMMDSLKNFMAAQLAALKGNPDQASALFDKAESAGSRYERLMHRLDGAEKRARRAVRDCRAD